LYDNTLSHRFRELADSGLLHGKQFRVGFGQSWVHTRLEGGEGGGLVSLATILQRPDPEVLFSIQNWLQVSNNGFILIRITKQGQFVRIRIRKSRTRSAILLLIRKLFSHVRIWPSKSRSELL
jgi:hypothetical protein